MPAQAEPSKSVRGMVSHVHSFSSCLGLEAVAWEQVE